MLKTIGTNLIEKRLQAAISKERMQDVKAAPKPLTESEQKLRLEPVERA